MITEITRLQFLLLWLLAAPVWLPGQGQVLEAYVEEGLANNPSLRQARLVGQAEQTQVRIAERLHYPTVAVQGAYTLAAGGRSIDLPLGDLLNPVYGTLNEITQTNQFPTLENVSELFAPHNFLDVKVRTTVPVINPDLRIARLAATERSSLQEWEIVRAERELAYQIRAAYYRYLQANEAVAIYENALGLLAENRRVNEALLRNDKINAGPLARADAEISKVDAQLADARGQLRSAQAQFNSLLNRPINAPIEAAALPAPDSAWLSRAAYLPQAEGREELRQLDQALVLNQLSAQQASNYTKPRLNAFVDLGAQTFLSNVTDQAPFVVAGLSLEWNLWNGNRHKLQEQVVELERLQLQAQRENTSDQLELQQWVSLQAAGAAYEALRASESELKAATVYFELSERSYRQDVINYLEYLDARTQLTSAQLSRSLRSYALWEQLAALDRVFANR